jgi:hypothetical protein
MDTTGGKKLVSKPPFQGDLYKKFFSKGLGALAHHQGVLVQPANLLLRFRPGAGMN